MSDLTRQIQDKIDAHHTIRTFPLKGLPEVRIFRTGHVTVQMGINTGIAVWHESHEDEWRIKEFNALSDLLLWSSNEIKCLNGMDALTYLIARFDDE